MTQQLRRRVGGGLIAAGVLAWVPYLVLQLDPSRDVSILPFLAAHLAGVIPGTVLLGRGLTAALLSRLAAAMRGGRDLDSPRA